MLAEHQHLNKSRHKAISVLHFGAFHYSKCRSSRLDQIRICIVESQLDIDQILSLNKARNEKVLETAVVLQNSLLATE